MALPMIAPAPAPSAPPPRAPFSRAVRGAAHPPSKIVRLSAPISRFIKILLLSLFCRKKLALICDYHFDTPVFGAPSRIVRSISIRVRGDGIFLPIPLRCQASFAHALVSQFLADSFGAVFGQSQVVSLAPDCV